MYFCLWMIWAHPMCAAFMIKILSNMTIINYTGGWMIGSCSKEML